MAKSSGFEFSGFRSAPVEREYFPVDGLEEGQGIQMKLNLDLLTLERIEQLENTYDRMFEDVINPFREFVDRSLDAAEKESEQIDEDQGETKTEEKKDAPPDKLALAMPKASTFIFAREKTFRLLMITALAGQEGVDDPDSRFIRSWNVVDNKKPVPVSFETFKRMPPHAISRLYQFCLGEANNPTSQEKKRSETT